MSYTLAITLQAIGLGAVVYHALDKLVEIYEKRIERNGGDYHG